MFNVSARFAETGRYLTPFRARGIRAIIISALNITALKIALSGVVSFIILSTLKGANPEEVTYNDVAIAGIMAKYLATSLAMLKVVSAPRVISNCFPVSTTSMSFVGLLSRSTILPASRAACVPVFIASPTSA